jgi:hypothetical protein
MPLQVWLDWEWSAGLYKPGVVLTLSSVRLAPDFNFVSVAGVVGFFVSFTTLFSIALSLLAENRSMLASNKVVGAASLAVVVLMIMAAVHESFFPSPEAISRPKSP